MQKSAVLSYFLLFLYLQIVATDPCLPQTNIDNLFSAQAQILTHHDTDSQIAYTYSFNSTLQMVPSVCLSLISFQLSFVDRYFVNLQVLNITTTGINLQFTSNQQYTKWTYLAIGIIVSARNQIIVGYQFIDVSLNNGNKSAALVLNKSIDPSMKQITRAFINGFYFNNGSNTNLVQVKSINLISMTIGYDCSESLQNMSVSFIIMNPTNPSYVVYGGTLQNLKRNISQSVQKSLSFSSSLIFGVSGINFQDASISFVSNIDKYFNLFVFTDSSATLFIFHYVLFGISPNQTCRNCPGTPIPFYNQQCVASCGYNQSQITFDDGSFGCITCFQTSGFLLNPNTNQCECKPGFVNISGMCRLNLTANTTSQSNSSSTSVQAPVTVLVQSPASNDCDHSTANTPINISQLQCPISTQTYWSGTQCVCWPNYYNMSGVCRECPENTYYNGFKCVPYQFLEGLSMDKLYPTILICTGNQVWNDQTQSCVCKPRFYPSNGACASCEQPCQECSNATVCKNCIKGYQLTQITNVCTEICGDGIRFNLPCDDGNNINGDGCSSICQVEPGYKCSGGCDTAADTCIKQPTFASRSSAPTQTVLSTNPPDLTPESSILPTCSLRKISLLKTNILNFKLNLTPVVTFTSLPQSIKYISVKTSYPVGQPGVCMVNMADNTFDCKVQPPNSMVGQSITFTVNDCSRFKGCVFIQNLTP